MFWHSIKATLYFALVSVPLRLIFALLVAMILVKSHKGYGILPCSLLSALPSIGGSVAVAILWKRMFAPDGVVNSILGIFGIDTNFAWLR